MRKKQVQSIKDILTEIIGKDSRLNNGLVHNRVLKNWHNIMGPTISRSTNEVYLAKNGVLFVRLNSSVVRNELLMLKDKIIRSLNQSVAADVVKDIVFK
ncbi:MAG: DUF721 domain-containing protein [Marinilabiliaceae bacterium]|nr:DUF721 domain-containing protein [Marinilabiliaceae bacterium]